MKLDLDMWLTAEDIDKNSKVVFIDEGKVIKMGEEGNTFDNDQFQITVECAKERRIWTVNKTSQRTLAKRWGSDTKNWLGKTCNVMVTDQKVGKEMRRVLYVAEE